MRRSAKNKERERRETDEPSFSYSLKRNMSQEDRRREEIRRERDRKGGKKTVLLLLCFFVFDSVCPQISPVCERVSFLLVQFPMVLRVLLFCHGLLFLPVCSVSQSDCLSVYGCHGQSVFFACSSLFFLFFYSPFFFSSNQSSSILIL
jgi:hypothetical protein